MPLDNLEHLITALQTLDVQKEQDAIIEAHKKSLADLQAEQWGSTSKDYAGRDIRLLDNVEFDGGYRPFTIKKKTEEGFGLGRITDRITLFQTGTLYKNLFATITAGKFFLTSDVPYFKKLMRRTGDVTGLDADKRLEFAEAFVRPGMAAIIKEKTGLTLVH
jgi:hypothetical protein